MRERGVVGVLADLRVGFYGFGSIGRLAARHALERGFEVVGAVDIDPGIVGRDVGELIGLGEELGVKVSRDPVSLIDADVVVHATGSYLDRVYPQLLELLDLGVDVVSTCETLAYPWYRYPVLARKLALRAVSAGATVLGAGVNPGFILDALLVVLASPAGVVEEIRATRSLDASKRRKTFQEKIGVGMDPEEYRRALESGRLTGHVGYAESVMLVADAAGLQPSRVVEGQEPLVAERPVESGGVRVEAGKVLGVRGYGEAYAGGRRIVRVELVAGIGVEDYEEVVIQASWGEYRWRSSGTPGDLGTVSTILSLAPAVAESPPGLVTVVDLLPYRPHIRV